MAKIIHNITISYGGWESSTCCNLKKTHANTKKRVQI